MSTSYSYEGVTYMLSSKKIHIANDSGLSNYIWRWGHGTGKLAAACKAQYKSVYGSNIAISDDSLVVEILGHFHAEGLLAAAQTGSLVAGGIPMVLISPLIAVLQVIVASHVAIIDCGEASVDSNRGVWDSLAPYRGVIETLLVD